eukprot:CAMPEP_0183307444 /NCGR_PEP_ID=MMETSP0160_2-20130417/17330_1 /TAXON_ID=2839 ORGANISM="Odontella Sinensis, Strain Grunow 1884" /NCGR_SAMPLE_ID=MMETSP0160_2 /ASSEMBLY_ACC=CAM_ASM_000250 /LENGTH=606 /DNA_ID=CAMNT_0025471029 /DNA_START=204 /DNA_END=2024 /DNA_ORIENTATION=-
MDFVKEMIDEQPVGVKATVVLFGVIFVLYFILPTSSPPPSDPVKEGTSSRSAPSSKKSKAKKAKAKAAAESSPSKDPEKADAAPADDGAAEASAPASAAEPSKKKKKKRKKKGGGGGGGGGGGDAAAKAQAPPSADDDEDSDDDDALEVARLLTKKAQAQVAGKKKKPKKKKAAAAEAAPAPSGGDAAGASDGGAKSSTPASSAAATPSAPEQRTLTINIAPEDIPILIGPKGATIQNLQTITGARLDVEKAVGGTGNARLKITGNEDEISFAYEQVQALINAAEEERRKATAHSTTLSGDEVNHSEGVKAIIGRGGQTIQNIQTTTETKIDASVERGEVVITGPTEEAVQRAATMCRHAVFGEAQDIMDLGSRSMVMSVYGQGYAKIRSLQDESGAKLDIDKGGTTLRISGSREAVAKAKALVTEWTAYCKGTTIEVEESRVGAVFGKGGTNLRRIQDRTGAFVEVGNTLTDGKRTFEICGEPEAVREAEVLFRKSMTGEVELKAGEVRETMDLGVGTPAVIGRGGSRVTELEKTHGVKILVDSGSGGCNIVGKRAAVDKAKSAIEAIIKPLIEEAKIREEADRLATQADSSLNAWVSVGEETGW